MLLCVKGTNLALPRILANVYALFIRHENVLKLGLLID